MLTRAEVGGDGFIQLIHCHNTYKRVVPGCNEVTEDGNDCTASYSYIGLQYISNRKSTIEVGSRY